MKTERIPKSVRMPISQLKLVDYCYGFLFLFSLAIYISFLIFILAAGVIKLRDESTDQEFSEDASLGCDISLTVVSKDYPPDKLKWLLSSKSQDSGPENNAKDIEIGSENEEKEMKNGIKYVDRKQDKMSGHGEIKVFLQKKENDTIPKKIIVKGTKKEVMDESSVQKKEKTMQKERTMKEKGTEKEMMEEAVEKKNKMGTMQKKTMKNDIEKEALTIELLLKVKVISLEIVEDMEKELIDEKGTEKDTFAKAFVLTVKNAFREASEDTEKELIDAGVIKKKVNYSTQKKTLNNTMKKAIENKASDLIIKLKVKDEMLKFVEDIEKELIEAGLRTKKVNSSTQKKTMPKGMEKDVIQDGTKKEMKVSLQKKTVKKGMEKERIEEEAIRNANAITQEKTMEKEMM